MRSTWHLLVLPALLVSAGVLTAQDEMKEKSEYFPLVKGSVWTYKVGMVKYTTTVAGFEKAKEGDEVLARLDTRKDKSLVSSELIAVRKDGVYRVEASGKKVVPALPFLKLPFKDKEEWQFDSKVGEVPSKGRFAASAAPKFKVGDTTYEAVKVEGRELRVNDEPVQITYWFAPKVGMIKSTIVIGSSTVEADLEKYEEKK